MLCDDGEFRLGMSEYQRKLCVKMKTVILKREQIIEKLLENKEVEDNKKMQTFHEDLNNETFEVDSLLHDFRSKKLID